MEGSLLHRCEDVSSNLGQYACSHRNDRCNLIIENEFKNEIFSKICKQSCMEAVALANAGVFKKGLFTFLQNTIQCARLDETMVVLDLAMMIIACSIIFIIWSFAF